MSLHPTCQHSFLATQVFGTPTVSSVISHKWRLYGRQRLTIRASMYAVFTFVFTVFAIMYSKEDRSLSVGVSERAGADDVQLGAARFVPTAEVKRSCSPSIL